ncbi:MAG: 2'-deoxycytidine 5'-triphosphate deaminase [Acetobacterales bacterium]
MAGIAEQLPAETGGRTEGEAPQTGVLPSQQIRAAIAGGEVAADVAVADEQIQPASLDLRLGPRAWRVRASFLPGPDASVADKLRDHAMHEIDLSGGAVLEKGCVYVVPLVERLALSGRLSAHANPKSSTGRLDIFTRLIADRATAFDRIERGYHGPLYLEIAPRTFSVLVRSGSRLNQLRLRRGTPAMGEAALRRLHARTPLVDAAPDRVTIEGDRIGLTLDLSGDPDSGLVGFVARKHTDVVDVDRRGHYDPQDFWDPIHIRRGRGIVLNPDDFYILATKESVVIPPDHAAEMIAYDTLVGEFRVHYAGFFDPGFGHNPGGRGSRAVLEVRSRDVPFMLEHEQIVAWLRYERLAAVPPQLYGAGIGSSYQEQGLALGKHFRSYPRD